MRYKVKEVEGFESGDSFTRVFSVAWTTDKWPYDFDTQVWWHDDGAYGNCTECSGPLTAMSASCAHVKAVRRFVNKLAAPPPRTLTREAESAECGGVYNRHMRG